MSAERQRSYGFSTGAQWGRCLFDAVDLAALQGGGGVRPFAPFASPPERHQTAGAFAPVVTAGGEILWRDAAGALYRLSADGDRPETSAAPRAIAGAGRIVATPSGLWVAGGPPDQLARFDVDSLTRELTIELGDPPAVDIAGDGRGGVCALMRAGDRWEVVARDEDGRPGPAVVLAGIAEATAFVLLRESGRFVVLDAGGPQDGTRRQARLLWFAPGGGAPVVSASVAGMRPCFTADALGSDGREKVFLAGTEHDPDTSAPHVLILDADGNHLGDLRLDQTATGLVGTRDSLFVTDAQGLLRFTTTEVVPEGGGEVTCMLVTPALDSPDRPDGHRWLRIAASAQLPAGSTIQVDCAATDDQAVRDRLDGIAADGSVSASARVRRLLADPDLRWRGATQFQGSDGPSPQAQPPYTAKLFDVSQRYLWVRVRLTASAGGSLPSLSRLEVLYPGLSLMQNLPAIYQQEEADPTSFLRPLVGVLEATTQGLDRQIGALGSLIAPATAAGPWLDFVARWLGVPWDDGLDDTQKRNILTRAEQLTATRGTRAGLEALLDALIPGAPRRFRVTDPTADVGFAVVGGAECPGSALPAILGGRTAWSAELDAGAVLGRMRLPCPGQLDDGAWQLAGRVRVDVAATAAERQAWEPWLLALINEMMPMTARAQLRWVSPQSLRSRRLDGTFRLERAPAPHLGTDAVTGLARLPDARTRLSGSGAGLGIRLL